ncbi:MAG: hypothetical protein OEY14_09020 [Myxococcales bacterium]|nr:hypothetical protein [Myxococcales bacterium]
MAESAPTPPGRIRAPGSEPAREEPAWAAPAPIGAPLGARAVILAALCFAVLCLGGCMASCEHSPSSPEAGRCDFSPPPGALPDAHEILVGDWGEADGGLGLSPWLDGGSAPLRFGGQGSLMLTPTIHVSAGAEVAANPCWSVTLEAIRADGFGTSRMQTSYRFRRDGERYLAGEIFFPVDGIEGDLLSVEAIVVGENFRSSSGPLLLTLR